MFPFEQVKTQDAIEKRFLQKHNKRGTVFSLKGEQFNEIKGTSLNDKNQEFNNSFKEMLPQQQQQDQYIPVKKSRFQKMQRQNSL